jgi:hypothetical protein
MLGEAQISVDGKTSSVWKTHSATEVNISGGGIISSFSGQGKSGESVLLDAAGNLHMDDDDEIVVSADGYEPGSPVNVWLFSSPVKLSTVLASDTGVIEVRTAIPDSVEDGHHRLVVEGTNANGNLVVITLGIAYGEPTKEFLSLGTLLVAPILAAVLFGFLVPRRWRRARAKKF